MSNMNERNKDKGINIVCFVCPSEFENVEQLCKHVQNVHKIRGPNNYQCKLCSSVLGEMNLFKRHLEKCIQKIRRANAHRIEPENEIEENESVASQNIGGVNLRMFEESIHASALKFALKLSSDPTLPRKAVFNIIEYSQKYIVEELMGGIKSVVVPLITENDYKYQIEGFLQICNRTFCYVETEHKFDSTLTALDLISPIRKFAIGAHTENVLKKSNITKQSDLEMEMKSDEETISDDEYDSRFKTDDGRIKVSTWTLMPIKFQLRRFFEEKYVFKTLTDYSNKIKNENVLNHFINGSLWKSKLSAFREDQIVIPYHLYNDETQINNALGTHCKPGLESCVYYTFPSIPPQYASRLQNIFVAMLFNAEDSHKFGQNCCFEDLVKELNVLAHEGVEITVDGKKHNIFFVLGLFLGDNANLNKVLGFNGFSATVFCKHCKMNKERTRSETVEDPSTIRTEENYFEDLLTDDEKTTGIKWNSIFNTFFLFHVVHSAGVDIMHDLSEGVLRYNMCAIISYFLKKKFFTLKTFFHNFGLMVGDLVPTEDKVWKFYLKTMEVVDLVYLTSFTQSDLLNLKNSISEMNQMYITLFNQTLKPKHHHLTHYPRLIVMFGPLRYISSMRYEAKHRIVKKYTKNTESRKNISYSIGRKLQYLFANIFISFDGLKDRLEYKDPITLQLQTQDFFASIENSHILNELEPTEICEIHYITMNGIFFSADLFIPQMSCIEGIEILKIFKVLLLSRDGKQSPYLLCRKYSKTIWCQHFSGYENNTGFSEDKLVLKSVCDLLEAHTLPISSQTVRGKEIFRLRNY